VRAVELTTSAKRTVTTLSISSVGAPAPGAGAPQAGQKAASVESSLRHCRQRRSNEAPHRLQNRAESELSAPHERQVLIGHEDTSFLPTREAGRGSLGPS
jgi:hypothetical protein